MRRHSPRSAGAAIREAREGAAPATPLAAIQAVWRSAVGPGIAAEADPVAERSGVVTITCSSAIWAQELDLLHDELLAKLTAALAAQGANLAHRPTRLRFTADQSRFFA